MRTKTILTSFALAATASTMFVACNNDEFVAENVNSIEQTGLIELGENFMIGATGLGDVQTRTHWEFENNELSNVYIPLYVTDGSENNYIKNQAGNAGITLKAPTIGLCWIGNGGAGEQVYTNYEFIHNGWLGKKQAYAKFNQCDDTKLTNGWLYSDLKFQIDPTAPNSEAFTTDVANKLTDISGQTKKDAVDNATTLELGEMNLNSGVYKTDNKAIFGGQYIAYYPYNPEFKDAGAIPAKSLVKFDDLNKNNPADMTIAENTFRYSNVATIQGGQQAEGFGFNNLSGVVRIILKGTGSTAIQNINKVMLYSPSASFVEEVLLSPAKIAAGAEGSALYSKVVKNSKTILVNMAVGQELEVAANGAATFDNSTVWITALPAKVSDLVVMVQKTTGEWAECNVGAFEIAAGRGKTLNATFSAEDFEDVYYAVDQATLTAAITKASSAATEEKPATIKVLGEITLSAGTTIPAHVIVEGDKIIVPEDQRMIVSDGATLVSTVVVEGQTCCGGATNGGTLNIQRGATVKGAIEVLAGDKDKKAGALNFTNAGTGISVVEAAASITSSGTITFQGVTDIFGTLTVNENSKATINGTNAKVDVKAGHVINNGVFEVNQGSFAMLDANGSTVYEIGQNFKNNGTFIDNIGTGIGGATQNMDLGTTGEYICKVDAQARLDEAYLQKTACTTIQIEKAASYKLDNAGKHRDKDINIIINAAVVTGGSTPTVATLTATSGKNITIGNLTVNEGKEGSVAAGYKLNVNGDIVLNGKLATAEDVQDMKAKNLTVNKNGVAEFANRNQKNGNTLAVAGTIEVKKDGTFTIKAPTTGSGNNIADVTCTKLVEGGTFTNGTKPRVVAAQ